MRLSIIELPIGPPLSALRVLMTATNEEIVSLSIGGRGCGGGHGAGGRAGGHVDAGQKGGGGGSGDSAAAEFDKTQR